MAAVATKIEAARTVEAPQAERLATRLFQPTGPTLEDAILRAWEDLITEGRTDCPVCGGTMRPAGGCTACGADLS